MKLFAHTLSQYLIGIARHMLLGHTDSRELRIFLSSFAPEIVYECGLQLRDYLAAQPKQVEFVYKVGTALWETWQTNVTDVFPQILTTMQQENWVDCDDKLTYYRNLKWDEGSGKECLIVVLIGVEQARDHASLKDFYLIDTATVWQEELRRSFLPWLERLMVDRHISTEPEHYQQMDELLTRLYSYGAGDLVRIADFLETVPLDAAQDGLDALSLLYENLLFWDLPVLREISSKKKRIKYLEAAITFFSYQPYLKEWERKKALQKIERFQEKHDNNEFPEGFSNRDDFLVCLRQYIIKNDVSSRQRLLQADFAFIKDKVLDIKDRATDEPPPPKPPKTVKIDAPPLEAVLTAIWKTFVTFQQECGRKNVEPLHVLRKISLQGEKFSHEFGDDTLQAHRVLRGLLGGLDPFLERFLTLKQSAFDRDDHYLPVESRIYVEDRIRLDYARSSIPGFEFSVTFEAEEQFSVTRTFRWVLPETHPYRNLWNFAYAAREGLRHEKGPALPIYHIPYYHELFLAPDEEEVNRIFFLGLNNLNVYNLLSDPNVKKRHDPLWFALEDLSDAYGHVLQQLGEFGYFYALHHSWPNLFKKMTAVLDPILSDETMRGTTLQPLIYKAFLVLNSQVSNQQTYVWQPYMESAVITALHPALLEMLRHRETFLVHGFLEKFQTAIDGGSPVSDQQWQEVCDLATVHCPLFGVIGNQRKEIDTRIEAFGLIHRIGKPTPSGATLAAKVLLRYDSPEDDDISESDLFRQTRESQVITRILHEYLKLHPYSQDGLSVTVLNAVRIQPIIAGVDTFIKEYLQQRTKQYGDIFPPFHFSLTLFMPTSDSETVSRWLQEWRKLWDPAQFVDKFAYYQSCRLSVSHRVVAERKEYEALLTRGEFEADVAILSHFISTEDTGNDVEAAEPYRVDYDDPLKFPIIEMARCVESHPSRRHLRARVLSNRRFRLATLHSELTACFKIPVQQKQQHIVISQGSYAPWILIMNRLHQHATWVLCLDALIDERLIYDEEHQREIIGFSSGVGLNGELNYTVSTERSTLHDIEKRIQTQVARLFGQWDAAELARAAHTLVQHSRQLSGLSLVRATGPSEYVRDLIAYTLVRLSLPPKESVGMLLCDELLALDSFLHWFAHGVNKERPDLMRLVAFLSEDGTIRLHVTLIECKLGKTNSAHVEKARIQLESGLRQLIPLFLPRQTTRSRFDQRFWWTQLQRLIATKAEIEQNQQQRVTAALEDVANGYFHIAWQALAVTFWTDSDQQSFAFESSWDFHELQQEFSIGMVSAGPETVKKICCAAERPLLPEGQSSLVFEWQPDLSDRELTAQRPEELNDTETVSVEFHEQFSEEDEDLEPTVHDYTESIEVPIESSDNQETIQKKQDRTITNVQPSLASSGIPERIFLGATKEGRNIFWEYGHEGLSNRHLLIFGKSGSGKTYAIQALLMELGLQGQNAVIIDYTNGFLPNHLEPEFMNAVTPKTHLVRQTPLPLNPFRQQQQVIEGFEPIPEDPYAVGTRVTSVFTSVYSSIGEQQTAALIKAIEDGIRQYGQSFNFETLLEILEDQGNTGQSLANKINPLVRANIFAAGGRQTWQAMFHDHEHRVNIMQLAGVAREISRMATEFILWGLYDFATNHGDKNTPLPLVLDEIQNLDHRLSSPLAKILTEGRKFGLSMILATQTLSNLHSEERDRLFQASQKLFFKPAETEVREYARILEHSTHEKAELWIKRLSSLGKGECYAFGPSLNAAAGNLEEKVFPIKITALAERIK